MEEIWKDIKGYEGYYQVSNLGRVKSLERTTIQGHLLKEKILLPHQSGKDAKNGNGYLYVALSKDGKVKSCSIHRLVAKTFLGECLEGQEVCHIDENRQNNVATNLVWGTHKENCNYQEYKKRQSMSQKGKQAGEKNAMYGRHRTNEEKAKVAKATSKITTCDGIIFPSLKKCAEYYGIPYYTMKDWMSKPGRMPESWRSRGLSYIKKEVD